MPQKEIGCIQQKSDQPIAKGDPHNRKAVGFEQLKWAEDPKEQEHKHRNTNGKGPLDAIIEDERAGAVQIIPHAIKFGISSENSCDSLKR